MAMAGTASAVGVRLPFLRSSWRTFGSSASSSLFKAVQPPSAASFSSTYRYRKPRAVVETPAFPCLDANEARTQRLLSQQGPELGDATATSTSTSSSAGPEPSYSFVTSGYKTYHHAEPLPLDYGGILPEYDVAYETWGQLNERKDNAILIHTGLSASSHAKSHPDNTARGWWEEFIGPGKALDTDRFFVICTNVLGGCYGSTGPSSVHPMDSEGGRYGTRFPILSIFDMVRAQFHLLDSMGIHTLFASVGSSMGGMQSIAAAHLEPERVQRVISISGCARSGPSSIALRFAQRSVLMSDPNWNRGQYYGPNKLPPHTGMKLARQIATITYRSGPEWEQRFGRRRRKAVVTKDVSGGSSSLTGPGLQEADPALCPDFEIESYIDYQGEQFCLKYDANSLIYISKAMDLFDMSDEALEDLDERRTRAHGTAEESGIRGLAGSIYGEKVGDTSAPQRKHIRTLSSPSAHFYLPSLTRGLSRLSKTPTLIIGAQSDILFPIDQQRELAECLRMTGNRKVRYSELDSPTGHDSFLIDVENVGGQIKGFLS